MLNELELTTDTKMQRRNDLFMLSILFAIIAALCWYFVGRESVKGFLFTLAVVFLALLWTYYRACKKGKVDLHFKGDTLEVRYGDGKSFCIKDVERSYFSLYQSEKQKRLDVGTLSVQSTNFKIQYVKDFSKMKEYINTHFEPVKKSIYYLDDEDDI